MGWVRLLETGIALRAQSGVMIRLWRVAIELKTSSPRAPWRATPRSHGSKPTAAAEVPPSWPGCNTLRNINYAIDPRSCNSVVITASGPTSCVRGFCDFPRSRARILRASSNARPSTYRDRKAAWSSGFATVGNADGAHATRCREAPLGYLRFAIFACTCSY